MALDREGLAAVANGSLASDLSPPYTNPAQPAQRRAIPASTLKRRRTTGRRRLDGRSDGIREKDGKRAELDVFVGNDFPAEWTAASELAVKARGAISGST